MVEIKQNDLKTRVSGLSIEALCLEKNGNKNLDWSRKRQIKEKKEHQNSWKCINRKKITILGYSNLTNSKTDNCGRVVSILFENY